MKVLSNENISTTVKVLKQLAVGATMGIGVLIGGWKFITEPQMKQMIEDNNIKQAELQAEKDSLKAQSSRSFRVELGGFLEVPRQKVSFRIYSHMDSVSKFMNEAKKYESFLETFSKRYWLSPYLDEKGTEWQPMKDLSDYRVNYEKGKRWVYYHGHRSNL